MDKGEQETELKKERSDLLFAEEREDKERRRQSKKGVKGEVCEES